MLIRQALLLAIAATLSTAAHASEAKLSPAPSSYTLAVNPRMAPPGTPRTITFTGFWSSTCGPTGITLQPPVGGLSRAVGVMVNLPPDILGRPCTADLRAYSFQATYIPTGEGQDEIIAVTNFGQPLTKGTLVTAFTAQPKAVFDISGAWADVNFRGRGLMVAHGWGSTDVVLATWQAYDSNGVARWYSLQETRWVSDGTVVEGVLYETRVAPVACPACVPPLSDIVRVGRGRLSTQFNGANGGLDARFEQLADDGQVTARADLTRLRF